MGLTHRVTDEELILRVFERNMRGKSDDHVLYSPLNDRGTGSCFRVGRGNECFSHYLAIGGGGDSAQVLGTSGVHFPATPTTVSTSAPTCDVEADFIADLR